MRFLIKNKSGKARELTLGGALIMIIAGIILLSVSATDTTGIIFWVGLVLLLVGIIGLIAILLSYFKKF